MLEMAVSWVEMAGVWGGYMDYIVKSVTWERVLGGSLA
jgi:hypothetical protein